MAVTAPDGSTHTWKRYHSQSDIINLLDAIGKYEMLSHSTIPVTKKVGHFQTLDVTDGLSGSTVYSILQDRNGFLWFGLANEGVCRYDGRIFTTFTKQDGLPSNYIYRIFEDSKGNLWFGTMEFHTWKGAGVCRYDGEEFQTYTTRDGLPDDAVTAICEDARGHLWFGTMDGVSEFDGTTFRNYTAENGFPSHSHVQQFMRDDCSVLVEAIAQDREGNLWFGHGKRRFAWGYGATRYDGESFKTFTIEDGLPGNGVTSIITDEQGNLWFGIADVVTGVGGVSKYDGESFLNFTTEEGLCDNWITDVYQSQNGDLWFAAFDGGVSRYRDGTFHSFTTKDGLPANRVFCITGDREGNVWFGTSDGTSRYDESVTSIAVEEIAVTTPIMDMQGNLWFSISERPCRYDGENIRTFSTEDGVTFESIRGFYEDRNGNIWISGWSGAGWSGIARYDGEKFQMFTRNDGVSTIERVCEDSRGILWVGTQRGGICIYDGDKLVKVAGEEELGQGWRWIDPITEDSRGNMWFSKVGHGVCRYDGENFTFFTTEDGLPSNGISTIIEDRRGNIWMGGSGGLCCYDGENFRAFTTRDGLAENRVIHISEDSEGSLWLSGSTGGVHKFDGRNFQTFTTEDGLLNNIPSGVLEDEAGHLVFVTVKGITVYTPPKEKIPPYVNVTEVVADKVYPYPEELKIPSTTPRISFSYHSMSFKTKRMRYNYMLEGYDTEWQATWDEQASYEDLKLGEYVFKVIAIDRDLVYSEEPATVKLEVIQDPRDQQIAQLESELERRNRELEAELQDARNVQMSLMPDEAPEIEGVEVAGKCLPANTVGGDFFDYLEGKSNNEIGLVIVDVTGKGMKGAMNAVMTDGILRMAAKGREQLSPASLLMEINDVLESRTERYMGVTMAIGMIDASSKTLTIANAGALPILLRDGEILQFELGGFPLGLKAGFEYTEEQRQLKSGDVVILMTDGIIETQDDEGRFYSYSGRLEETLRRFTSEARPHAYAGVSQSTKSEVRRDSQSTKLDMSAEAMVEAIFNDALSFGGDKTTRDDDMTVVVAKIQ